MNTSQARDFVSKGVGHAALFPLEEPLRGQPVLAAEGLFQLGDEFAMVMSLGRHAPVYQRSVYDASRHSLIAAKTSLMHNPRMSLGDRIIAAYTALGISQAEAARRCGWSPQRFGQYTTDRRTPDLESLVKMAERFNTTPDHLLGISEQQDSELIDILGKLLELEGLDLESARTIAEAATATQQVLKTLPGNSQDQERARLVAQAVWSARRLPRPDTALDQ